MTADEGIRSRPVAHLGFNEERVCSHHSGVVGVREGYRTSTSTSTSSRTSCNNYRGIALLSVPGKVFAKAILNRLKPRAEQLLQESQCGFRRGRGCADQLFSLRMLMEKAREYHQPIYACFIDLKKAYDSVYHESLWRILQHSYCLPPKLLSIIRALHEDSTAAVRAYRKLSDKFSVTSGVHQGCVLAPTLFNFYFDVAICMALEEHRQQGNGINLKAVQQGQDHSENMLAFYVTVVAKYNLCGYS